MRAAENLVGDAAAAARTADFRFLRRGGGLSRCSAADVWEDVALPFSRRRGRCRCCLFIQKESSDLFKEEL